MYNQTCVCLRMRCFSHHQLQLRNDYSTTEESYVERA